MVGRVFLGRYEAVRLLGEGGMGKVYLARQLDLGRQVVVKVMHDHIACDEKFRDRFERETRLMASFQHPFAVSLYDASLNDPNGPCIIMEYVRGINLETLLAKNGRLSPSRIGRLLSQLCDVLQNAHDQGIVHRDLKPANLMVMNFDSPQEKIKVLDFGLAKLVESHQTSNIKNLTESNVEFAVGTPGYISPEQVRGEPVDRRSDLYSVGVILYELLTGRLPFLGSSSMDLLLAHATEMPPHFVELDFSGLVPDSIEDVVFACLAKNPDDRPQSARELAEMYMTALSLDEMGLGETTRKSGDDEAEAEAILVSSTDEDPSTLSFNMEAWMPESIAVLKLRGFVQDWRGQITESVPGLIKVQMVDKASLKSRSGVFSLMGFGRRIDPLQLELHLHQMDHLRGNHLHVQVVFRPTFINQLSDPIWRERCIQLFIELKSYLMAT